MHYRLTLCEELRITDSLGNYAYNYRLDIWAGNYIYRFPLCVGILHYRLTLSGELRITSWLSVQGITYYKPTLPVRELHITDRLRVRGITHFKFTLCVGITHYKFTFCVGVSDRLCVGNYASQTHRLWSGNYTLLFITDSPSVQELRITNSMCGSYTLQTDWVVNYALQIHSLRGN